MRLLVRDTWHPIWDHPGPGPVALPWLLPLYVYSTCASRMCCHVYVCHRLLEYGKYGCCPSSVGFLPYQIGGEYCCKIEGATPGHDYQISKSPCKCHRYGC